MFSSQRNPSQKFLIWLGVAVIGMPLAFWFAYLAAPSSPWASVWAFIIALAAWLAFCIGMRVFARWLGLRTVLIGAGMLLVGVPLAYLAASATQSGLVFLWFLAFWTILSGLLTRNARAMYVALHFANWFFFLGILSMNGFYLLNVYTIYLAIPLGIMLILLGLYRPVTNKLALFPFMRHGTPIATGPKSPPERAYETGYQAAYEEGGRSYTYSSGPEKPMARYPSGTMQQQQ